MLFSRRADTAPLGLARIEIWGPGEGSRSASFEVSFSDPSICRFATKIAHQYPRARLFALMALQKQLARSSIHPAFGERPAPAHTCSPGRPTAVALNFSATLRQRFVFALVVSVVRLVLDLSVVVHDILVEHTGDIQRHFSDNVEIAGRTVVLGWGIYVFYELNARIGA